MRNQPQRAGAAVSSRLTGLDECLTWSNVPGTWCAENVQPLSYDDRGGVRPVQAAEDHHVVSGNIWRMSARVMMCRDGSRAQGMLGFRHCDVWYLVSGQVGSSSFKRFQEDQDMAEVTMPMNGKVIDVKVAAGDAIQDDSEVVIIEAMKMELPVVAENSGTVKEVKAKVGESYQVGDVLVVIE